MLDTPETESAADDKWTTAQGPSMADAVRESIRSLAELVEYAGYLLSTKIDQLKLSIRTLVLYAALLVMGGVAVAAVLVVSVVLLFVGAAHGVGAALDGRDWLGDLIVSVVMLGAAAVWLMLVLNKFKTASRRRTVRKYEERRKQQHERFGR